MGLLFLAARLWGTDVFMPFYPFFTLGIGGLFFLGMLWGGPAAARLAIPGSILSMLGVIQLLQATFQHYESWSYAWSLIIVAVGIGQMIRGWWGHDEFSFHAGQRIVLIGFVLFAVFGGFFEFALGFGGYTFNGQVLWAGGLILLGLFLVIRSTGLLGRPR
jgi:hypothetical protein